MIPLHSTYNGQREKKRTEQSELDEYRTDEVYHRNAPKLALANGLRSSRQLLQHIIHAVLDKYTWFESRGERGWMGDGAINNVIVLIRPCARAGERSWGLRAVIICHSRIFELALPLGHSCGVGSLWSFTMLVARVTVVFVLGQTLP